MLKRKAMYIWTAKLRKEEVYRDLIFKVDEDYL